MAKRSGPIWGTIHLKLPQNDLKTRFYQILQYKKTEQDSS